MAQFRSADHGVSWAGMCRGTTRADASATTSARVRAKATEVLRKIGREEGEAWGEAMSILRILRILRRREPDLPAAVAERIESETRRETLDRWLDLLAEGMSVEHFIRAMDAER